MRNAGKLLMVIFYVLVCQFSFGQSESLNEDQSALNSELSQNLQGEWLLSETEIVDGHGFVRDTNRFISAYNDHRRKIVFKGDSVDIHPVQGKRFYTGGVRSFQFEIEYDTLFSLNALNLYEGRKRKRQFVEDYVIKKCDRNELIIQSFQSFNSGLDEARLSIYYTYRREGVDSLLSQLFGEWANCSKENQPFLFDADSSELTLARSVESRSCNEYDDHFISLNFRRNRQENICWYSSYSGVMGGGADFKIQVDPKNNLIYFDNRGITVFNIIEITENKLVLSFNWKKTEALRIAPE